MATKVATHNFQQARAGTSPTKQRMQSAKSAGKRPAKQSAAQAYEQQPYSQTIDYAVREETSPVRSNKFRERITANQARNLGTGGNMFHN